MAEICLEKVTAATTYPRGCLSQRLQFPLALFLPTSFLLKTLLSEKTTLKMTCGNTNLLISLCCFFFPVLKGTTYLINIRCKDDFCKYICHHPANPRCRMKVNKVKMFRFMCWVFEVLQVWKNCMSFTSGFSGMFSGH